MQLLEKEVQREMMILYKFLDNYKEGFKIKPLDKEDQFYFEKIEAAKRLRALIAKEVVAISKIKGIDKIKK